MDSTIKLRYAIHRESGDFYMIFFRPDCERTTCDWKGDSESLSDMISRLDFHGWDLVDKKPKQKNPKKKLGRKK